MQVSAVVRKTNTSLKNVQLIVKELNAQTSWKDSLSGIDVVIHLAGRAHVMNENASDPYKAYAEVNIDATKNLAEQAALNGVKRFIFLSSIKVNGEQVADKAFTELSTLHPEDDYAKTKYEAELCLKKIAVDTDLEVVIIRPPLIYGKGVKANFKSLIKLSQLNIPLPFGAIYNKRSMIYIENLIDFIMLGMQHPKAANEVFLISDDEDVSTTRIISCIREASKMNAMLIPIPQKVLVSIFKVLGKATLVARLCGSLQADITKAKTLLEWKPPYSFKQGITKTITREI
jgi:UDP-glucose 4-epimerase